MSREMIPPHCSALLTHLEHSGLPSIGQLDILEQVQSKAAKIIKGLRHLTQ